MTAAFDHNMQIHPPEPKTDSGAGWLGRLVRRFPFRIVGVTSSGWIRIPRNHPARHELVDLRNQVRHLEEKYYDLLFAVQSKHDGETRHETAYRYITEREERCSTGTCDTPNK